MINPVHILNQMGVITSFSVAKKVSEVDVHKFFSRRKKDGKTEAEINEMLKEKILGEIEDAVVNCQIPGLLNPQELAAECGINPNVVKNIPELHRLTMVIGYKLAEKKYDRMSLCYLINNIVNLLGLTEQDFEKFHQQNNNDTTGDDNFEDA